MMNIKEGDVNLGVSRLSGGLGAGGNANSMVDLTFPPSAPLSELVWSPHNGLSLKCANSTVADDKNLGTSNADEPIVESSYSARLSSTDVKRECLDESEINVTKKMKSKAPDSSFKNWISTMVKSPSDCTKQDSSSLLVPLHEDLMSKKGQESCPKSCSITCDFCGGSHDLQCPNARKSELVVNKSVGSLGKVQESSCMCIGCSHCTAWNVQISATKIVSTSKEMQTAIQTKGDQKLAETLRMIRNLRLSRADVLRWMNSNLSLSGLNGFFVRLRLGKMESGVDVPGYYVGCILGDAKDVDECGVKKKCIMVDVGGIKSCVPSQYVSNQDFLEDEIEAWCRRIVDCGCTVPSLDELTSKFDKRKSLGL